MGDFTRSTNRVASRRVSLSRRPFAPFERFILPKTTNASINALGASRKNAIDWKPHLVRRPSPPRFNSLLPLFPLHQRVPAKAPGLLTNAATPVERNAIRAPASESNRPISRPTIQSGSRNTHPGRTCLPRRDSLSPDISPADTPNFCRRFCLSVHSSFFSPRSAS